MRGLGLGQGMNRGGAKALPVVVYSVTNVGDWFPTGATIVDVGSGPQNVMETATDGSHGAFGLVPFESGHTYRVTMVLGKINESLIEISSTCDSGAHYWLGDFTDGTTLLSAGISNFRQRLIAGGNLVEFDMEVTDASVPGLNIGIAKPGPTTSFMGAITDGISVKSVVIARLP